MRSRAEAGLRGGGAVEPAGAGGPGGARLSLIAWGLLVTAAGPVAAQGPGYTEATLGCARFAESLRGSLESRYGSTRRNETLGRDGLLVVRAVQDSTGLTVESWYDSLAVFREGPEGTFIPPAEGILGGRYVGTLDPQGDYLSTAAPFVPAALRDVFEFGRLLLHFFPPLPPRPLAVGAEWTDGAGLTIWRLADSAGAVGAVDRYRWTRRDAWDEGVGAADTTVVVRRTETERGSLQWRAGEGPLGWATTTTATVALTNGAGESALTQEVVVRRVPGACR